MRIRVICGDCLLFVSASLGSVSYTNLTFMRTKLKDVVNGYVLERRFNIGEKLEDVRVERRPHQRCV